MLYFVRLICGFRIVLLILGLLGCCGLFSVGLYYIVDRYFVDFWGGLDMQACAFGISRRDFSRFQLSRGGFLISGFVVLRLLVVAFGFAGFKLWFGGLGDWRF